MDPKWWQWLRWGLYGLVVVIIVVGCASMTLGVAQWIESDPVGMALASGVLGMLFVSVVILIFWDKDASPNPGMQVAGCFTTLNRLALYPVLGFFMGRFVGSQIAFHMIATPLALSIDFVTVLTFAGILAGFAHPKLLVYAPLGLLVGVLLKSTGLDSRIDLPLTCMLVASLFGPFVHSHIRVRYI